jgi:hypothetical protein
MNSLQIWLYNKAFEWLHKHDDVVIAYSLTDSNEELEATLGWLIDHMQVVAYELSERGYRITALGGNYVEDETRQCDD